MHAVKRGLWGTFAAAAGSAALAAPPLPAPVAAAVKEMAAMCTEAGGKAHTENAVHRVDLNGDGHEDYVFFVGSIHCEGSASLYGDREKAVMVYAGDGKGGVAEPFKAMVFDAKVEGSGKDAKLWLGTSGEGCGKGQAANFASESFCDRAVAWNARTKKFEFAPVSTVRMIE